MGRERTIAARTLFVGLVKEKDKIWSDILDSLRPVPIAS